MVLRLAALLILALSLAGCAQISPQANANLAFMGDSITALWWLPRTNFGVSGDMTAGMLARFPTEVLAGNYKAVIILGGTNDIRGYRDAPEATVNEAVSNIAKMAQMAEQKGMEVILCTIPPLEGRDVGSLNAGITALAAAHHYLLVDYYTPMAGHPDFFVDGIHPSTEGYIAMEGALTKVISITY
jgi:lysophospholipase L1-like esterase